MDGAPRDPRASLVQQLLDRGIRVDGPLGDARDGAIDAIRADAVAKTSDERRLEQVLDRGPGRVTPPAIALAVLLRPLGMSIDGRDELGHAVAGGCGRAD